MYLRNIYKLFLNKSNNVCNKNTQSFFNITFMNFIQLRRCCCYQSSKLNNGRATGGPIILIHGGAGNISPPGYPGKHKGVRLAASLAYQILVNEGSAIDAVEAAIRSMESDSNFNAGYGSVLNLDGEVAMDASIMDGRTLKAGCVTLVNDILHPITLAKRVMEQTNHTFLGGEGVMRFAKEQGFEILYPPGLLVTQAAKTALERYKQGLLGKGATTELDTSGVGTVGAVALDKFGNIAAATSTGGMTGKLPGRIGDSPLIGSGTYADSSIGGISTTGHGETIMRVNVAQSVMKRIELLNEDAQIATKTVLDNMTTRLMETAGAITIDKDGNIGKYWTSEKMSWAYIKDNTVHWGIEVDEDLSEPWPFEV